MNPANRNTLPDWMIGSRLGARDSIEVPGWSKKNKKLSGFVQKTVYSVISLLEESLFQEHFAKTAGLLQTLDPRAKLLAALALLTAVSLLRGIWTIWFIYLTIFALAVFSKINVGFFLKRVWLFVPLFSAVMAIPATLSWVTPGRPVWMLYQFEHELRFGPLTLPSALAVTDLGLNAALLFVSRVALSVSIAVLLVLTTPWQNLLRALRVLGVPHFFVFALGMSYRYIHLLLNLMLELHLGRQSRTLRASSWSEDQGWVAARMGYLFKRSHTLGESVYNAMLSRGFQGEPKMIEEMRWKWSDLLTSVGVVGGCVILVLFQPA